VVCAVFNLSWKNVPEMSVKGGGVWNPTRSERSAAGSAYEIDDAALKMFPK
jgi:hypothetical protein